MIAERCFHVQCQVNPFLKHAMTKYKMSVYHNHNLFVNFLAGFYWRLAEKRGGP